MSTVYLPSAPKRVPDPLGPTRLALCTALLVAGTGAGRRRRQRLVRPRRLTLALEQRGVRRGESGVAIAHLSPPAATIGPTMGSGRQQKTAGPNWGRAVSCPWYHPTSPPS